MVRNARYGDGVANPARPSLPAARGHSQSFTAGSNPNSAPMPNFSGQRRRSQPAFSSHKKSYSPLLEPSFDLMSTSGPSQFGDMSYQMPAQHFDQQQDSNHMNSSGSYDMPRLSTVTFPGPFDSPAEHFLADGLYNPASSALSSTEFPAMSAPDMTFSHPPLAPNPPKTGSPFISNGPVLAPPVPNRPASATDSMNKTAPQTPRKIVRSKSVAAASSRNQPLLPAPSSVKTPTRALGQRDPNANAVKRHLPDSPTLEASSPRKAHKRSKTDEPGRHRPPAPIPGAESFPAVDPGEENSKPPYTYAQMIALAIWKAPARRRTLAQIYDFIRTTWCYYRKDDTWENSIRHNLSLHKKFFEKQARAKDDPGKGNYWLIIPGNERELLDVYLKERSGTEGAILGKSIAVPSSARLEPSAMPPPHQEPMLPSQPPNFQLHLPPLPTLQPPAPVQPELSSDATIPASDQAFEEFEAVNDRQEEYNSLDATLSSSPPSISGHVSIPSDTPTRTARALGSSGRTSGNHKRGSMIDSGYMTNIESSILRYGQQRPPVFSSEADIHQFQGGGRAEDAIRKLRASSPVSPSKSKSRMLPPSSSPFGKGSPLRYRASPSKASAAVKTPANKKKSVARLTGATTLAPPKTTSKYNTSPIRQHDKLRANIREMLETPQQVRDYNKKFPGRQSKASFAIWEDEASLPESESPLANSAGRMLDEIMSEKRNRKPIASPFKFASPLKAFPLFPPIDENTTWNLASPSKLLSSPSKYLPDVSKLPEYDSENWIVPENADGLDNAIDLENFGSDDSNALDLTQTFRSIGEVPAGAEAYGPATLHRFG
ncbi:fork head domain-containing protein [Diaporthe helianthi]|uniref:Fork head domain-containing protein n=1 Tax=Diaporthe helianthi TaxID=158607 RepID=A0A2P5IGC5_DIAHE|nr:fork head domain-containing protein [Diaporthe helianthi]